VLAVPVHPDSRRLHYISPLAARDRFEWAPERRVAPGFDFNEGHQVTAPGHQIQLDSADAKAMRDNLPASALEKPNRLLLTGEAPLVAIISPIVGIAVNAARHATKLSGCASLE
jgi:hypothetical protein